MRSQHVSFSKRFWSGTPLTAWQSTTAPTRALSSMLKRATSPLLELRAVLPPFQHRLAALRGHLLRVASSTQQPHLAVAVALLVMKIRAVQERNPLRLQWQLELSL